MCLRFLKKPILKLLDRTVFAPGIKAEIQSLRQFTKYALRNIYSYYHINLNLNYYLLTDTVIDSFF